MARRHDDPVVQERLVELLKEVIDACGSEDAAGEALGGLSQSLVNQAKNRRKPVSAEMAVALAIKCQISLDDLYDVGPAPWSKLPGWNEAIKSARALFPRVRTAAFQRVGAIREPPPEELDPAKLGLLASMFDKKVPKE